MAGLQRIKKEIKMLEIDPPPGVSAWPIDDSIYKFIAQIQGPEDTPYVDGNFELEINLSDRYPFEPPSVRFITPIYHPNIDDAGRICLDTLKMPPKGSWTPSLNISTLLTTILVLLSVPNPDDGLMLEITEEYRDRRDEFERKARELTLKHAMKASVNIPPQLQIKNNEKDDDKEKRKADMNINNSSTPSKRARLLATNRISRQIDDDSDSESD